MKGKSASIKLRTTVWLPCEVKGGPFPNERRIYVNIDESEWFGFVDISQLKAKVDEGADYIRAVVTGVQPERVVLSIRGHSPASNPIQTRRSIFSGFNTIAA
jgi:hypothetical protein